MAPSATTTREWGLPPVTGTLKLLTELFDIHGTLGDHRTLRPPRHCHM